MDWIGVVGWLLQGVAAIGAIWGLYSKETTKDDPSTAKKRLTGRGWVALAAILIGVVSYASNQWRDHQKAERAEVERRKEGERAEKAERTLSEVRKSQTELTNKQQEQLNLLSEQAEGQMEQIQYLKHLALTQQKLEGIEFSWEEVRVSPTPLERTLRDIRKRDGQANQDRNNDENAYLDVCLLHREISLSRRPNYSWRIDCKVARPLGMKSVVFEIAAGDRRMSFVDAFIEAYMTEYFLVANGEFVPLIEFSNSQRPTRIDRRNGIIRVQYTDPSVRFSSLENLLIAFRLQTSSTKGLPKTIRVRSLDQLTSFDQEVSTTWEVREYDHVLTQTMSGEDPELIPIRAAFSNPQKLNVTFDRLLQPTEATRK